MKINQKGSITIFICVIFFIIIMLVGLFIDLARVKAAQNQLRRAVNASARSVLADYNTKLRSSYGIFGTNRRDFNRDFNKYLLANLSTARQQDLNLLDIRYETGNIVSFQPVSSNEVVKKQILESMKYKAPVEIGRELVNKFMQFRNAAALFDQSNENRKSLNTINEKTKSLHENNQNIKRYGADLEKSKAALKKVKGSLKTEKNPDRVKQLVRQREHLEKHIGRMRNNIAGELHKAERAGLEIEVEVKKIKENRGRDVYKNNEAKNNQPDGKSEAAETEVSKETQSKVEAVEKNMKAVKAEIASTKDALKKEVKSNGAEHYIFSSMGIDSASKAYEQIKNFWNKTVNPAPLEAELTGRSQELMGKYPGVSRHINIISVAKGVKAFETNDAVKGDNAAEFFRRVFGAINIKANLMGARDEMYINEYILTYFSYLTSSSKGDVTYPYSKTEAEYICFGKNGMPRALSELYLTRFALDSAGYFAYTKGIPELTARTIFSLSAGAVHAAIDTIKLAVLNEPVPIVSVQPDNPLEDVTLTYKDHLRLFLLLKSDEKAKLDRIRELIKARSSLDPRYLYTNSAGTATISIRLWFLPMTGLTNMEKGPFETSIRNGRCYITKEVEFGY